MTELDRRFPGLVEAIAGDERVAFAMVSDGSHGLILRGRQRLPLDGDEAAALLARYDQAGGLVRQLQS